MRTSFLLASFVVTAACSATPTNPSGGNGGTGNNAGNGGSGNVGNFGGDGGLLLGGFGGGTGGGTEVGCSADLQSVVDGMGNVIQQCPSDQGCSGGQCVAACQAAADSKGTVGCDYLVATPHFYTGIAPPCFAVFLANNWSKDAAVTVKYQGNTYDMTQFGRIPDGTDNAAGWAPVPATGIPPGQVAVLFLSHDPSSFNASPLTCPVQPAISQGGGTAVSHFSGSGTGSGLGNAWSIVTDVPVSAYDILPFGGAASYLPSAELLYPTTAWGTNYIAVLPKDSAGPPWGQIVAKEDNTTVTILSTTSLSGNGQIPSVGPNGTATFVLNAGEFAQWEHGVEMTGSILQSDKPISFTGGNGYICYSSATSNGGGCDSGHQQIPPVNALGSEYVGAPYATRMQGNQPESVPYRVVGGVDGTVLTYDPPVPGAPTVINSGQRVDFEAYGAFRVFAQDNDHPFYLGEIMTGCNVNSPLDPTGLGDEEYVNLLPPAQFLNKYVFFTDTTYPTTNLTVVRKKTDAGFQDVNVACYGNVGGWQDVGSSGDFQIAQIYLVNGGIGSGACKNGPQSASSNGPFGIMVWGLSTYASYGYPAGGNVATINTIVIPPVPN